MLFFFTKNFAEQCIHCFVPRPSATFQATSKFHFPKLFLFEQRTVSGTFYNPPRNRNFFLLREFCKDRNKWKSEGSTSDNCGLSKAGIKIARRNINNLRYADDTTLMVESEEELKSLLMKVKEEGKKVDLKLNIQKMKIMASGPITHGK